MKRYQKLAQTTDLREEDGRIILAHGEATGHHHQVSVEGETELLPNAEYFAEPDGRRVLLALRTCVLRHPEHGPIVLDPATPEQVRQGDVLLTPIGIGAWEVTRQREYAPAGIRQVAD